MNFLNKKSYRLKTHAGKIYSFILAFIVIGLAFFLGTGFFLEKDIKILASPIHEEIDVGETQKMTINEWIYDKDNNAMRVIIDAHDFIRDYKNIDVEAYQR